MKTNVFCSNLLDDPIVQPAKSVRIPRLPSTRRWEQIRIRRVFFMLLYKKLYCICWEQHCSDGIWRFWRADDQLSVLPRDAFMLLNRIDSIPASEKAGTLYLRIYPYVDPDKITTMFLFATSPLLSQSGNAKSSIKGNTLNSDSLNRKSPCSSSLYKRRHCLPSVTAQTRLLLFNKCLWLHKQKIKSHHSSTRSAISLASLTASAS